MVHHPSFLRAACAALFASLAFTACAGSGSSPSVQPGSSLAGADFAALAQPVSTEDRLFAVDAGGFPPQGPVYIYREFGTHQTPIGHFGSFNSSLAVATDNVGNLYVADSGTGAYDGRVYVYAKRRNPPSLTLDDSGALPADLTVASDGTVYLANGYDQHSCGGGGDVRVYRKGQSTAWYTICDAAIGQNYSQLNGIALDAKGDVFVSWESSTNTFGKVVEFTPGPHYVGSVLPPTFKDPYAVAIDASGNIVVSDASLPGVEVFAPGASSPKFTFAKTGDPTRMTFDASGRHIFVSNALANQIDEYAYPSGTLVNSIAFPGQQLDGIAVSPRWIGPALQ